MEHWLTALFGAMGGTAVGMLWVISKQIGEAIEVLRGIEHHARTTALQK